MKFLAIISFCLILSSSLLFAQDKDSTDVNTKEQKTQKTEQQKDQQQIKDEKGAGKRAAEKELKGFVDVNANGIDDRLETSGKGKGKAQPRDRFVDADGDGICDGKESAIGLRKLFRKRKGKQNR